MLLKDLNELEAIGQIGDWCFLETTEAESRLIMFLRYPVSDAMWARFYHDAPELNRGDFCSLPLSGNKPPVWQWDGNRESPTLTPSINVIGRWHGWLREGKLVTA